MEYATWWFEEGSFVCFIIVILIVAQIDRKDVKQYNGVGKPPHCEIVFKAVSDDSAPPDLNCTVIIAGTIDVNVSIFRVSETG